MAADQSNSVRQRFPPKGLSITRKATLMVCWSVDGVLVWDLLEYLHSALLTSIGERLSKTKLQIQRQ
jgi:hypothetical protein